MNTDNNISSSSPVGVNGHIDAAKQPVTASVSRGAIYMRRYRKTEHGKAYRRAYDAKNRRKLTEQQKAWALHNTEAVHERDRRRYARMTPLKRAAKLQYHKDYRKRRLTENPHYYKDTYRKQRAKQLAYKATHPPDAQRRRVYSRKYRQLNKDRISAYSSKRRAVKQNCQLESDRTSAFIRRIRRSKWVMCYYCRIRISGKDAHIDHIVALTNGGSHTVENLCSSCPRCNLKKKTKRPHELTFLPQLILNL